MPMSCKLFTTYLLTFSLVTILSLTGKLPIRINLTGSMPRGIYLRTSSAVIKTGDFVQVCLDDSLANFAVQRGYLHPGNCKNHTQPLLKKVVAVAGDRILLSPHSTKINGIPLAHSAVLNTDPYNRPLPSVQHGTYILKTNQSWLYGTESNRSWDSRYFGAVDSSSIQNIVKPLFTWP